MEIKQARHLLVGDRVRYKNEWAYVREVRDKVLVTFSTCDGVYYDADAEFQAERDPRWSEVIEVLQQVGNRVRVGESLAPFAQRIIDLFE